MSWFAAVAYCEWLSHMRAATYRLPTEAEWEKACRGGIDQSEYAWGNEPPQTIEYFRGEWKGPRNVAEWSANGYGLFNIGDNVHEWCSDWYAEDYYARFARTESCGPGKRNAPGFPRRFLAASDQSVARCASQQPAAAFRLYGLRVPDCEVARVWHR